MKSNFRLPTKAEFETLKELPTPNILFSDSPIDESIFWTSTTNIQRYAWVFDAKASFVYKTYQSGLNHVRLVRESSSKRFPTKSRFQASPCNLYLLDKHTGLEWKRQPEPGQYSWDDAMANFDGKPPLQTFGFLSLALRQRLIKRWSLMHCVQAENVLEHSAIVGLLTIIAAEIATQQGKHIDKAKMLQHALLHDVAEVLVGDVVTPVKRANPEIHSEFKKLEDQAEQRLLLSLPEELRSCIETAFNPGGYEQKLVKACDSYSAYIKCKIEVGACNSEFSDALVSMEKLVSQLREEFFEIDVIHQWFSPGLSMSIDKLLAESQS